MTLHHNIVLYCVCVYACTCSTCMHASIHMCVCVCCESHSSRSLLCCVACVHTGAGPRAGAHVSSVSCRKARGDAHAYTLEGQGVRLGVHVLIKGYFLSMGAGGVGVRTVIG